MVGVLVRGSRAVLALCLVTACDDLAQQKEDANNLAATRADLECEQRFSLTSCGTSEFSDQDACVMDLTRAHRADNAKFFDAGAEYHHGCAERGVQSWPFTGRCQEICALFTGPIAEGGRCDETEALLCQQGLLCREGRCTDPHDVIAAEGEPCAGGQNRVCAAGLACSTDGMCTTAPNIGLPCLMRAGQPEICDTLHFCDDNGTCQQKRTVGQVCTRAAMCETLNCISGLCTPSSTEPPSCWGMGTLYACE